MEKFQAEIDHARRASQLRDYDPKLNLGKDPYTGKGVYLLKQGLSPRHKLLAGLKALGMTNIKAGATIQGANNKETKANYGATHICHVTKDPLMKEEIDRQREAILGTAKKTLMDAVNQAAQNYHDKVFEGDLKASEKVLEFASIFKKETSLQANINMSFGSWLSAAQEENALLVGSSSDKQEEYNPPRLVRDVDEIPDEELDLQGVRLTDNPGHEGASRQSNSTNSLSPTEASTQGDSPSPSRVSSKPFASFLEEGSSKD